MTKPGYSTFAYYGENCRGQCGKKVNTKTGYCKACREFECVVCHDKTHWIDWKTDICTACRNKKKQNEKKLAEVGA